MEAPKPGIYRDIPSEDYHRWDAANYSSIKQFAVSAAHAYTSFTDPWQQTPAQLLGDRLGESLLTPAIFANKYVLAPDFGARNRNPGKKQWDRFKLENASREILEADVMGKITDMRNALQRNPTFMAMESEKGLAELSFVWVDPDTGVLCKGRCDWYGALWGNRIVCDVKTTSNGSELLWPKEIAKWGYHIQAAFYLDGLNVIAPDDRTWLWACVESKPPFLTQMFQCDEDSIAEGRRRYKHYLELWKKCKESGLWPGYPEGLTPTGIPHWAYQSDEELGLDAYAPEGGDDE